MAASNPKPPDPPQPSRKPVDEVSRTMFCPIIRGRCRGEECMMWRRKNQQDTVGFCGLAGPDA